MSCASGAVCGLKWGSGGGTFEKVEHSLKIGSEVAGNQTHFFQRTYD